MNDPCFDATGMQHAEIAQQFVLKITMPWGNSNSKPESMHILDCRKQLIN